MMMEDELPSSYFDPPSALNQITLINGEKILLRESVGSGCSDDDDSSLWEEPSIEALISFTTCKEMINMQATLQASMTAAMPAEPLSPPSVDAASFAAFFSVSV